MRGEGWVYGGRQGVSDEERQCVCGGGGRRVTAWWSTGSLLVRRMKGIGVRLSSSVMPADTHTRAPSWLA